MSTFEQRLQEANLKPFKTSDLSSVKNNNIKDDCLFLLIKQLYKYQHFNNASMLSRVNRMHYNEKTTLNYATHIRTYLATGVKNKYSAPRIYEIVDTLKAKHEAILVPASKDRVRVIGKTKKEEPVVETKVEETIIQQSNVKYGVICEDKIRVFDTKEHCYGFIECYNAIGDGKEVKIVKVTIDFLN